MVLSPITGPLRLFPSLLIGQHEVSVSAIYIFFLKRTNAEVCPDQYVKMCYLDLEHNTGTPTATDMSVRYRNDGPHN